MNTTSSFSLFKSFIKKYGLVITLCLPFLLRIVYYLTIRSNPYFTNPLLLGAANHQFALDILNGSYQPYTIFRPPYYSIVLSWLYYIFGTSIRSVQILQWLTGALNGLLIYTIGNKLLDRKTAIMAVLIYSFYIPAVFFEGELTEQAFSSFFVLGALSLFSLALKTEQPRKRILFCIIASGLYGIAFILRPDLVLGIPLLMGALILSRKKLFTALLATIPVWICIGWIASHPGLFIPIEKNHVSVNAAINFYLGNNDKADGWNPVFYDYPYVLADHPEARRYHVTEITITGVLNALKEMNTKNLDEVSRFWKRKAVSFIVHNKLQFSMLVIKKCLLFFNGGYITNQKDIYVLRNESILLYFLLFNKIISFPLGLILSFAFLGFFSLRKSNREILVLTVIPTANLFVSLIFFHSCRFQYAAIPFFILLGASGWYYLSDAVHKRRWRVVLFTIPLLFLANNNFFGTHIPRFHQEYFNIGTMYLNNHDYKNALHYFELSLKHDPDYMPAIINMLEYYTVTNKPYDGIAFFSKHLETHRNWATGYAITKLYHFTGNNAQAQAMCRQLMQMYPDHPENYLLLFSILNAQGQYEQAQSILKEGIAKYPDATTLKINLASLYFIHNKMDSAVEVLYGILKSTQHYPDAYALLVNALVALNRNAEARPVLENGLKAHPDDDTLLVTGIMFYTTSGKTQTAISLLENFMQKDHANPALLRQCAVYCDLLGKKHYGKALTEKADLLEQAERQHQK
ncbi:MAG: tetratricopeptide repeat protein [Candidatus Auribacterota bacterium]